MATTDLYPEPHHGDHQSQRRRPFSAWVKKIANFKSSDGDRSKRYMKKKRGYKHNNPYPQSGHISTTHGQDLGSASFNSTPTHSRISVEQSIHSLDERELPDVSGEDGMRGGNSMEARSIAARSHGASSLAGTNRTTGGGMGSRKGGDSTFSSPAPSVGSLATTLTTIQSLAPNNQGQGGGNAGVAQGSNTQSIQFSQPFPTSQTASAIPQHLAPSGNPTTYTTATANNLLTDNASILTLASSSKRRRRRSMDTDASVRALAPSSLWGGSRESLPLSVLSSNIESSGMPTTPGLYGSSSRMGAERNSIYSATGIAPTIASERNSIYTKQGDGASVRSGLLGHGRNDSIGGTNALTTQREMPATTEVEERTEMDNAGPIESREH